MAKVFTTVPGLVLNIGGHGLATNSDPAIVPDEVAAQLEAEIRGEVVAEVPDPEDPAKRRREVVKFAAGPRRDIRVERDGVQSARPPAVKKQPEKGGEVA